MKNTLEKAVQQLCLAFPETEELISHGMPNYRVRGGKIFAMYAANHHGDGRWIALESYRHFALKRMLTKLPAT